LLHELAHVRRWDNLSSSFVHVLVCLFWFHPLLWWIERRMVFERERACDEIAVQSGAAPETYVSGILKVCRFQLAEAIAGAAGIKGPGFKRRMELIMSYPIRNSLPHAPRALLGALAAVMTVAPFIGGFLQQSALRAQTGGGGQKSQSAAKPGMCSFAGVAYPEGTVLKMGTSAYAATKDMRERGLGANRQDCDCRSKGPAPVCLRTEAVYFRERVRLQRARAVFLGGHREHGKRQDAVRQVRVRAVHHVAARDPG
jgi:hypothetical protein